MNTRLKLILPVFVLLFSGEAYAVDTQLTLYRPFGDKGQSLATHSQSLAGQCWQQSQRIKREDAWRCVAGGAVFDPCFVKQYGDHKEALCVQSPWLTSAILLTLTEPADNHQHVKLDMSKNYPWAVQLSHGQKCQAVDEGNFYDGMPIHYQCEDQTQLVGHLQRCNSHWSMLRHSGNDRVETVMIDKAWF